MSRLNQELGLLQGIGLLSTSLLGTGIFVVPALAATAAGEASLWAWMILIALVLPVAFTFAQLGRHFPHAGGAPHLIGRAFGARMERLSALLFGVLLAGLVYWACSVAVLSFNAYGDVRNDATSLPRILDLLLGDQARYLTTVVGYLACFASMNVYMQGFARLIWSLADEGKLPTVLARRNEHGVPARALLLVIAICALCATLAWSLSLSLDQLIRYANGNFVVVYLLSMAAGALLLRGIWRWLAAFSTLLCALVLTMLGVDAWYALGLLAVMGLLDYARGWRERAMRAI